MGACLGIQSEHQSAISVRVPLSGYFKKEFKAGSHYIVQAGLEPVAPADLELMIILLLQPSKC